MTKPFIRYFSYGLIATGVILILINLYGLTKPIAPQNLKEENLRFSNDQTLSFESALDNITWLDSDTPDSYADRINNTIAQRLAHVHWTRYAPSRFNQRIPIWENFILYSMSYLTNIPEYERYHFANPYRSLERGIGICGDASMIMSQLLDDNSIENQIITFPGHVVVSVKLESGRQWLYDPDFNVTLPYTVEEVNRNSRLISPFYYDKGYSNKEVSNLVNKYGLEYKVWDGVSHFITNKYYFEKAAYVFKWLMPIGFILIGLYLFRR